MNGKFNIGYETAFDKTNRLTVFVLFLCGAILASVYVPGFLCRAIGDSDLNKFLFMFFPIVMAALFGTSLFGVFLLSVDSFMFGIINRCFAGLIIQRSVSGNGMEPGMLLAMLICVPVFFIVTVFGIGFSDRLVEASAAHMQRMSFLPMFILSAGALISVFYIIG